MRKLIIALVVASASLVPGLASSQATATTSVNDLQADAPTQYTVVKGDTLWAISGKFLKEPWRWPEIWQMNRDQIKNPHLIYPGDVIRLDRNGSMASLSLLPGGIEGNVVRLQPRTRIETLSTAIPSIPGNAIGPFLTQPLVLETAGMDQYPRIVATEEERVVVGTGNLAYVNGLRAGDPVLAFSWTPGLVWAVGGRTLVITHFVHDFFPGARAANEFALAHIPQGIQERAFVIHTTRGARVHPTLFLGRRRFPADYRLCYEGQWPVNEDVVRLYAPPLIP